MKEREFLRNVVKENIERAKIVQKKYYDNGKKNAILVEGDMVLVDNKKMSYTDPRRYGPFVVEKVLKNDNYLVYNHLTKTWKAWNISQLLKYVPREFDYPKYMRKTNESMGTGGGLVVATPVKQSSRMRPVMDELFVKTLNFEEDVDKETLVSVHIQDKYEDLDDNFVQVEYDPEWLVGKRVRVQIVRFRSDQFSLV